MSNQPLTVPGTGFETGRASEWAEVIATFASDRLTVALENARANSERPAWVTTPGTNPRDFAERFWSKVRRGRRNECWPWLAGSRGNGYGAVKVRKKVVDAHVVAYELQHGARPLPGIWVTHKCDNRKCCNPNHLVAGTPTDNFNDMVERGRECLTGGPTPPHVPGELHGAAKLTWVAVREMRALAVDGANLGDLSVRFGVHRAQVRRIVLGERWKEPAPKATEAS